MSIFDSFKKIIERAIHIRGSQLRGTPGVRPGSEDSVAAAANAVISAGIDAVLQAAPGAVGHILHVKPEQLRSVPGVHDAAGAAAAVNEHLTKVLGTPAVAGGG